MEHSKEVFSPTNQFPSSNFLTFNLSCLFKCIYYVLGTNLLLGFKNMTVF